MEKRNLLFLLVFPCLGLSSCDNKKAQADYVMFRLNEVFQLPLPSLAKLESEDLEVQFAQVVEDSRCPEGVTCVWAGQVKIRLSVSTGRTRQSVEVMRQGKHKGEAMVSVGNYQIYLLSVNPYPKAGTKIKEAGYSLELMVREE